MLIIYVLLEFELCLIRKLLCTSGVLQMHTFSSYMNDGLHIYDIPGVSNNFPV